MSKSDRWEQVCMDDSQIAVCSLCMKQIWSLIYCVGFSELLNLAQLLLATFCFWLNCQCIKQFVSRKLKKNSCCLAIYLQHCSGDEWLIYLAVSEHLRAFLMTTVIPNELCTFPLSKMKHLCFTTKLNTNLSCLRSSVSHSHSATLMVMMVLSQFKYRQCSLYAWCSWNGTIHSRV